MFVTCLPSPPILICFSYPCVQSNNTNLRQSAQSTATKQKQQIANLQKLLHAKLETCQLLFRSANISCILLGKRVILLKLDDNLRINWSIAKLESKFVPILESEIDMKLMNKFKTKLKPIIFSSVKHCSSTLQLYELQFSAPWQLNGSSCKLCFLLCRAVYC